MPNYNPLITDSEQTYYGGSTGGYRYISIEDIANNFMVGYVGDGKIIQQASKPDVLFHVKRGIQEFNYDINTLEKIQEIELPPTLTMAMPQDYVKLTGLFWIDSSGAEHPIPKSTTSSRPSKAIVQDTDYNYTYDGNGNVITSTSITQANFESESASIPQNNSELDDHVGVNLLGGRYGIDPTLANINGSYIIDELNGVFGFSSNLNGLVIVLKYISDGLGSDSEMKVSKLAEEALYKYVLYAIASTRDNIPEYQINRFRREKRAAIRNTKIRLYNLTNSGITQTLRGQNKQIKH
jgi:hypothetical protein